MKFETTKHDLVFKNLVETCAFPASGFNHRAHLKLAYIYLTENNADMSSELMRDTLYRFLLHNDVDPSKYNATITKAWILAVYHFMNKADGSNSADEFVDKNPEMLDSKIMMTHYSTELLFSEEARVGFVKPDLEPIPR